MAETTKAMAILIASLLAAGCTVLIQSTRRRLAGRFLRQNGQKMTIPSTIAAEVKLITVCAVALLLSQTATAQLEYDPERLYPELFESVQTNGIFPDQKTFVDCIPKRPPDDILASYRRLRNMPAFQLALNSHRRDFVRDTLRVFVQTNFNLPPDPDDIQAYIKEMWQVLRRNADPTNTPAGSLLPLPFPYLVPGGRFREIYYWDSYFTMLGLEQSGKTEMISNMVANFTFLIQRYGFIPNGNRSYYLSRSQPPYFSLMIDLLTNVNGEQVYTNHLSELESEYKYWMDEGSATGHVVRMSDGSVLNRYYDQANIPRAEAYSNDVAACETAANTNEFYRQLRSAAESGWDFSSRWFADGKNSWHSRGTAQTTDLIPVDLNCLLFHLEQTLARAYTLAQQPQKAAEYTRRAAQRKEAINRFCWSVKSRWYVDFNLRTGRGSDELTLAGVAPLFFRVAPADRAPDIAKRLKEEFLQKGGVVTTLKRPQTGSGEQWDYPNGWAPLQWLTIQGLENYGEHDLASKIARCWIDLNVKVFKDTGRLMEKYNVVNPGAEAGGGEYRPEAGFGWTNGVFLKLISIYGM